MQPDALLSLFLPHLRKADSAQPLPDPPALAQALREASGRARAAWPALSIPEGVFLPYLARRMPGGEDLLGALGRIEAGDLYLACACIQADEAAIALLQRRYLPKARAALLSMGLTPAQSDDIEQGLCLRLLVAAPGDAPQLARYSGRGPLPSWLCIVAVREARQSIRRQQREPLLSEELLLDLVGADGGSELGYLKQEYRDEFRIAFQAAVQALSARERNVLRCHLSGDMTNAQIGALCGVHPGTVKRWMSEIRERLLDRTREVLRSRLGLTPAEVDSLIRLIRSDIDVSIDLMVEDQAHPAP